jgi:uncharacterized protein with HEPN domain
MYHSQLELLRHILDECNFLIQKSESLSEKEFYENELFQKAFVRSLEIIGEAATKSDPSFMMKHPQIPWKLMRGLRNRLIHQYFDVDYEILWQVIKVEIPEVRGFVESLIESNLK